MIGIAQPDLSRALATVAHGAGRTWPGMYVHIHQGEKTADVMFRSFANGIAEVSWDDTLFTTRVVEGQYPNYQQIIPPAFQTSTTFDRKAETTDLPIRYRLDTRRNPISTGGESNGQEDSHLPQHPFPRV